MKTTMVVKGSVHRNAPTMRSFWWMRLTQCLFGRHYFVDYYVQCSYGGVEHWVYTKTECGICGRKGERVKDVKKQGV